MATYIYYDTGHASAREQTVAELVLAAQSGDRDAFGILIERYEGAVFATAIKRLRNYEDARELCQDVFIQAMQKLDQLRQPECFGGWVRAIAARMAVNRATRRAPTITTEYMILEAQCVDHCTPVVRAEEAERGRNVREGLARLRSLDRQTLEAFYVRGSSINEMSAEFDAPVGTIKRRLHTARARLALEIEEPVSV